MSVLTLSLVLVLASCGGGAKTLKSGLDLTSLADKLRGSITFADKDLRPLPDKLWNRYIEQVDKADLKQYVVIAGGGATAEEIALFEAKDKASADKVAKAMEERYEYFRKSYGNYTPEQLKNLEKPALIRNGNYVFSVFCGNNDKAREIIENWIKAQA